MYDINANANKPAATKKQVKATRRSMTLPTGKTHQSNSAINVKANWQNNCKESRLQPEKDFDNTSPRDTPASQPRSKHWLRNGWSSEQLEITESILYVLVYDLIM